MNEVSDATERYAEEQVRAVLKSLLRNLTEVRNQQRGSATQGHAHRNGVADGLNIAIAAVRRRIR